MYAPEPTSSHPRADLLQSSDFEDKMVAKLQDLKTNMADSIQAAIEKAVALLANKPPPPIVIGQEVLQATNYQALETKREIDSLKGQLGR